MRYPKDRKAKTRERILTAAASEFRRNGYHATGVDAVMGAAGLTAGGFYAHFKNKADLFTHALQQGFDEGREYRDHWSGDMTGKERLLAVFRHYLSVQHLHAIAGGCPLPALLPEVARGGGSVREETVGAIDRWASLINADLDRGDNSEFSTALIAMAAGAIEVARVMTDPDRAEALLDATYHHIAMLIEQA